jgi:prepilin-type N-terminal cleavage/methylation domain-containing protein
MKTSVKQNSAFTLIEMIGVLAIIGILAAVVAPRVIESIRDAKVTSAVASVSAAKTAAIGYYQRYDNFPLDVDLDTVLDYKSDPVNPVAYTPAVGALDFGDVLVRQSQLLEQEKAPIGRTVDANEDEGEAGAAHAIGCAAVGSNLIGGVPYTGTTATMRFKSSGSATRVVYYYMPNLTLQEASALAAKVNGPFTADAVSDKLVVEASIAGNGIAAVGGLEGANCWFNPKGETGEYDAYLYVSHQ